MARRRSSNGQVSPIAETEADPSDRMSNPPLFSAGSTVYSMVMAGASVILIVQSIQELAEYKPGGVSRFYLPSTVVVAICVAAKFCLFCYCYGTRTYGPECRVLYEDHRCVVSVCCMTSHSVA